MLTFALLRKESTEYEYATWKDGDVFPKIDDPSELVSMAATDKELEMIRQVFVHLPDTTTDIVIFPYDIARFVYMNLRIYLSGK